MRGRRFKRLLVLASSVTLLAAACGGNNGDNTGGTGGNGGNEELSGKILVSGSSTVQPITSLVAETFAGENPNVDISVDGPGTSDGFELFCKGETDINDASRAIEKEEEEACSKAGVEWVELEIAQDGITVMTSNENSSVTCLTNGDLYALFGPESEGFKNWSDADGLAKEVGGKDNFPDAPLDITAPGEESGTYDAFIELALGDIIEERGQEEVLRPDYQSSGNDNVIIQGVEGSPSSIGFVGFAFAEESASELKILQVDGGDGCIAPSRETISDASYPLSRSLYIYVNKQKAKESPALQSFVDLYLEDQGIKDTVQEAGYVDLPSDRIEKSRSAWQDAGF